MSIIRKEKFVCPVCNTEGDYKVYRSVNVDLDKSIRCISPVSSMVRPAVRDF